MLLILKSDPSFSPDFCSCFCVSEYASPVFPPTNCELLYCDCLPYLSLVSLSTSMPGSLPRPVSVYQCRLGVDYWGHHADRGLTRHTGVPSGAPLLPRLPRLRPSPGSPLPSPSGTSIQRRPTPLVTFPASGAQLSVACVATGV